MKDVNTSKCTCLRMYLIAGQLECLHHGTYVDGVWCMYTHVACLMSAPLWVHGAASMASFYGAVSVATHTAHNARFGVYSRMYELYTYLNIRIWDVDEAHRL